MRFEPFMRTIDLLMVAMLVGMVIWTFKVKYDSQIALERVAKLESQVAAKKTEIGLLKSDWSLLTNPARLEQLADRYGGELGLQPINPSQITNLELLPPLRQPFDPVGQQKDFADTQGGVITGGIRKVEGGQP